MGPYRITALDPTVAQRVRKSLRAPGYEHPAHVEVAAGLGPCRACLRLFKVGEERRILFTYDSFAGREPYPLPGPIFIHEEPCVYEQHLGVPDGLSRLPVTLNAYQDGRTLISTARVDGSEFDAAVTSLLQRLDVDYVQVHGTEAGCFIARVEPSEDDEDVDVPSC